MTIREVMISMGYREVKEKRWAKPVGLHLFTFDEEGTRWTNWFYGVDNKMHIWETHEDCTQYGEFLVTLKQWEAWTRISCGSGRSQFQLAAIDI